MSDWAINVLNGLWLGAVLLLIGIVGHNLDLDATRKHEEEQTKISLQHHWLDLQQARLEYDKQNHITFVMDQYPFGTQVVTQGQSVSVTR